MSFINNDFKSIQHEFQSDQEIIQKLWQQVPENASLDEAIDRLDSGGVTGEVLTSIFSSIVEKKDLLQKPNLQAFAEKIQEHLTQKSLSEKMQKLFLSSCEQMATKKEIQKEFCTDVATATHTDWLSLPQEIWLEIFQWIPREWLPNVHRTCRKFFNIMPKRFASDGIIMGNFFENNTHRLQELLQSKEISPLNLHDKRSQKILEPANTVPSLDLSNTKVTDDHLAFIPKLFHYLKSLIFHNRKAITDERLQKILESVNTMHSLDLSHLKVTDDHLAIIPKFFPSLKSLILRRCAAITGKGLEHLSTLPQLQSLSLYNCCQITGKWPQYINTFPQLQSLNLSSCDEITDEGLKNISTLSQLQSLDLSYCYKITDKGLQYLSTLPQLQSLSLLDCHQITDEGLQHVSALRQLQSLNLHDCYQITDKGLQYISTLPQLQSLHLTHCYEITDEGLQYISTLPQLQSLNLTCCDAITDKGLQHISTLPQLQSLNRTYCLKWTLKPRQFFR